jgi:ADP-heptose:LPS heptosyltransferase
MDSNLALVARVCEKKWDDVLRLGRTPEAVKKMKEWLDAHCSERAVIAVHVGTSHPQKRWPVERFVELCRRLQKDRQEALVFIGGGEEREATRQVLEKLERPAFDLCGRTTLAELAAFFADRRVRTLVSSDSGPVHVAWISGKPVVAFYALDLAGSDPARWGPRDMRSRVIHKPMKDISVDETLAALEQVLA